jgi:hypothetical protein
VCWYERRRVWASSSAASLAIVCAIASPAAASGWLGEADGGEDGARVLKLGVEAGGAAGRDRGAGVVAGAIATLIYISPSLTWFGGQADLLVDSNGDADAGARWSIGPEVGHLFVGGDISYIGERVAGETHHGIAIRPKLTIGIAAVYLRYARMSGDDGTSVEAGVQLKLPLKIW